MEIVYRAFDGKEFTSKAQCEEYEEKLLIENWKSHIKGLDSEGKVIKYNSPNFCSRVYVFYCTSQEALEAFQKRSKEEGTTSNEGIKRPNIVYAWSEESSVWEEINEVIDYYKYEANRLQHLYETIMDEEKD